MPHSISVFLLLAGMALPAWAQSISLVGTIGDKAAILSVNGGAPKSVRVGQAWQGVSVLAVENDRATIEVQGKKSMLKRGELYGAPASDARQSVTIPADSRGHYFAEGAVNGSPVRFVVDTGATVVALPASEANRIGLQYRGSARGVLQTANGTVAAYKVRLDSVRVGSIELQGVEAVVIENGLPEPLLGMSFLNRTEMKNEGRTMTLIRRF